MMNLPIIRSVLTRLRPTTQINASFYCTTSDVPKFDMENPFRKDNLQCVLCKYKITADYKNVKLLSQFQSPYTGRIYGRHITGLCSKQQEKVEKEIIKAQSAGLMGTYLKDPVFLKDPKLFNPDRPIRPHEFK
nr:28S ribosomal protein S18c, mitochondrial [Onthophagus taurus]